MEGHGPVGEVDYTLVRAAEQASRVGFPQAEEDSETPYLSEFLQIYREWIASDRGALGTNAQQVEQWQMLVHCMLAGRTVEAATRLLVRFAPVVWGDRAPKGLHEAGPTTALIFHEPFRPGAPGLIASLWMLSLILCTLEFLAGTRMPGVSGRVVHAPCLPDGVADLLFGAPVDYSAGEVALVLPSFYLQRPVVVQASDLPGFFSELLPLTLGAKRGRTQIRVMVRGLLRADRAENPPRGMGRADVAARLGISEAGLKRGLKEEGTTFRAVKDAVYNELARDWLESGVMPVEKIACRLGFSDTFAFRRFFHRCNQCSPSAWRRIRLSDI